jgi:KTSC domain-containing protein
MERIAVVSRTGMTGYAFDAATKTLEISFASRKPGQLDSVYQYAPFTSEQLEAFVTSESLGSHFLKVIKPRVR